MPPRETIILSIPRPIHEKLMAWANENGIQKIETVCLSMILASLGAAGKLNVAETAAAILDINPYQKAGEGK